MSPSKHELSNTARGRKEQNVKRKPFVRWKFYAWSITIDIRKRSDLCFAVYGEKSYHIISQSMEFHDRSWTTYYLFQWTEYLDYGNIKFFIIYLWSRYRYVTIGTKEYIFWTKLSLNVFSEFHRMWKVKNNVMYNTYWQP